MMEKYKTLNNSVVKDIIRNACFGNYRAVYIKFYNYHDSFTDELYYRLCQLIAELCPLTLDVYDTLPHDVKNYYNQLWLNSHCKK